MENLGIQIKNDEEIITISYESLKQYHQDTNYAMLAITFKGLQGAFKLLENIPNRKSIKVLSAHPGTGVRDTFEFVTRVVTNNNFTLDCALPYANYNPHKQMGYYFEVSDGTRTVKLTLKENILQSKFFEFFGKSQKQTLTKEEIKEFNDLKKSIEKDTLEKSPNEIFELEIK